MMRRSDSNWRPFGYEPNELPTAPPRVPFVCFGPHFSNALSYYAKRVFKKSHSCLIARLARSVIFVQLKGFEPHISPTSSRGALTVKLYLRFNYDIKIWLNHQTLYCVKKKLFSFFVHLVRLELTTPCLRDMYSRPIELQVHWLICPPRRTRTFNPLFKRQVHLPLSYRWNITCAPGWTRTINTSVKSGVL